MARSDNTEWHRSSPPSWKWWQFREGAGRDLRRRWQKQQRQRERQALQRGDEPEPARPRHSVQHDYW
jgi:hypothetical protein